MIRVVWLAIRERLMQDIIIVVHLMVALGVIVLVLIQQGKGADAGASFGSGASATVFGSQGSSTFLSRSTAVLVAVFFATSLLLGYFAHRQATGEAQLGLPDPALLEVPVVQDQAAKEAVQGDVPVVEAVKPAGEIPEVPAAGTGRGK